VPETYRKSSKTFCLWKETSTGILLCVCGRRDECSMPLASQGEKMAAILFAFYPQGDMGGGEKLPQAFCCVRVAGEMNAPCPWRVK
jgi:hypothetical protein